MPAGYRPDSTDRYLAPLPPTDQPSPRPTNLPPPVAPHDQRGPAATRPPALPAPRLLYPPTTHRAAQRARTGNHPTAILDVGPTGRHTRRSKEAPRRPLATLQGGYLPGDRVPTGTHRSGWGVRVWCSCHRVPGTLRVWCCAVLQGQDPCPPHPARPAPQDAAGVPYNTPGHARGPLSSRSKPSPSSPAARWSRRMHARPCH